MRRSLNRLRSTVFTVAAVALAACNLDVAQPSNDPSDPAKESFDASLKINIATMTKTTGGDYFKDVTVGTGGSVSIGTVGAQAVLSYVGFLKDASPFAQTLNTLTLLSQLPPGLQDGMTGMREGGERIVVVPSANGYGPNVLPGIPANSTLVFDVIVNQVP
jgi:FKBP-type peptidyl-prolyl cis-trans isomerase